jgi:hypothetical protein
MGARVEARKLLTGPDMSSIARAETDLRRKKTCSVDIRRMVIPSRILVCKIMVF